MTLATPAPCSVNEFPPATRVACCVAVLPGANVIVNVPEDPAAMADGSVPSANGVLGLFVAVFKLTICCGLMLLALSFRSVNVAVTDDVVLTFPKLIAVTSSG